MPCHECHECHGMKQASGPPNKHSSTRLVAAPGVAHAVDVCDDGVACCRARRNERHLDTLQGTAGHAGSRTACRPGTAAAQAASPSLPAVPSARGDRGGRQGAAGGGQIGGGSSAAARRQPPAAAPLAPAPPAPSGGGAATGWGTLAAHPCCGKGVEGGAAQAGGCRARSGSNGNGAGV